MEPSKSGVLNESQSINGSKIATTPNRGLIFGAASVFEPNGIDLAGLASVCGKFELLELHKDDTGQADDLTIECSRIADQIANRSRSRRRLRQDGAGKHESETEREVIQEPTAPR
jgi:hypothetical protein